LLDFITGVGMPITFGKRTLLVGALKLREEGLLVGYLRANTVSPLTQFEEIRDHLPKEQILQAHKEAYFAQKHWPPAPTSPEGQRVLFRTPEGQRFFLGVVLRKYQPDLSDADLEEILVSLSNEDFMTLAHIAFGEDGTDPESVRAEARANLESIEAANLQEATAQILASLDSHTTENSSPNSPTETPDAGTLSEK
jgi:hypothetical protein